MSTIAVQALVAAMLGSIGLVYVAWSGRRSEVRPPLLGVLAFLIVWMAGRVVTEQASTDAEARAGMLIRFFGACGLGPTWLCLAARFTHAPRFERQPILLAAAWVPPAITYLALLTNDGHRLFSDTVGVGMMHTGPTVWGGPIFWAGLAWQILLVSIGVAMFVRYARGSLSEQRRRHAYAIAAAGALPLALTVAKHGGALPTGTDLVVPATLLAVAASIAISMRYRLLDSLPMARRDVIDALHDGVLLTDADGTILDLNPAARSLLGDDRPLRDQPLARSVARLGAEEELESIQRSIEAALRSNPPVGVPVTTRTQRELEVVVGSVREPEEEATGHFALIRDLTETRRLERLLRESQKRTVAGGMAAALAHEVNNPLAFVASNLQQIHRVVSFDAAELTTLEKQRGEELAELDEVVAETMEGVERIAEIVGRIIQPSELSDEQVRCLDVDSVVRDAVRLVELDGARTVHTQVDPIGELPEVEGCPERLSQALLNLLLNAQTTARQIDDASLFVGAAPDVGGVQVRLGVRCNDGSPYAGALPPMAPPDPTAEAELSAAYETVRAHGGTLEAGGESDTLFVVRLPAAG